MNKTYINNLETGKIELHFTKQEYNLLTDEQKKDLKSNYLWSNFGKCWVSRSKNNHHWAIKTAEKLGFTDGGKVGERLSYAEELERKAEKAEHRMERYEQYADNAEKRAENLQKELNSMHGDIAFFTQPIIAGHAGSQAFARRREKIFDRYRKGFEEYRKSGYYQQRAETVQKTVDKIQLKNPIYLNNRIEECNKNIRQLEKNVTYYEDIIYKKENSNNSINTFYQNKTVEQITEYLNTTLDKMEYEMDKLAFMENAMDEIRKTLEANNKKMYTKEDLKPGYLFLSYRHKTWAKIIRVNPKTVTAIYIEHPLSGFNASCPYAEIKEIKIPEGWSEPKTENPFQIGNIVYRTNIGGNRVVAAFQVVKTSDKTVTIQQIKVEGNKPITDCFTSDKQERKTVKQDRSNNFVLNDGDWYLYRYTPIEEKELQTV